jgi:hypothetical protein
MQIWVPAVILSVLITAHTPAFGTSEDAAYALESSGPNLRSLVSYMSTEAGHELFVTNAYTNTASETLNANFISEVRDARGVTVLLQVVSGSVGPDNSTEVAALWIPEDGGTYELRTFAISDLDGPSVLSPVRSQTVTVDDFSAVIFVQSGNKTFEVPVSMAVGWIIIEEDVMFQEVWPRLYFKGNVSHDNNITLRLPLDMLKLWESASDLQYCVGFPLEVMVDGRGAAASMSDPTEDGQAVIIPIGKGTHEIEILGTSLLMSPSEC